METTYNREKQILLWTLLKKNAPPLYHELAIKKVNKFKKQNERPSIAEQTTIKS